MRCLVSGRVQGVFFRAATLEQAQRLGLQASAVNLDDGRVEVVATGDERRLAELRAWLHEGPSAARVHEVSCEGLD